LQVVRLAKGAVHIEIHFAYLLLASNVAAVRRLPTLMQRVGLIILSAWFLSLPCCLGLRNGG